jgi:membrane-bound metal-dependent hydrolase YbcI (DUF457 family)
MNREWHLIIGGCAFILYQHSIEIVHATAHFPWIIGLLFVAGGSILPDRLEPAAGWRHRGICHSKGMVILMIPLFLLSALIAMISPPFPDVLFVYLASCFFLGYLFHLLVDSLTPMGLPG